MDIRHFNKKNLRAHRRTVSSNLEDFCLKKELDQQTSNVDIEQNAKQNNNMNEAKSSNYVDLSINIQHEVVKLINASSKQVNQKRIIIDSFQPQQQRNKIIQNSISLTQSSYFKRKHIVSPKQNTNKNTFSFQLFMKKHLKLQKAQQTKNKLISTFKNKSKPNIKSQYFQQNQPNKIIKKNSLFN